MPRQDKAKSYVRTKVLTANPAELRLMLFDGAIRFAEMARAGLAQREYESAYVGVTRCQDILMELINSLRPEHDPELCKKLSSLYTFMFTCMMQASSERDPAKVDEVLKVLRYERETWSMLLEQMARENASAKAVTQLPAAHPPAPADATADASSASKTSTLIGGRVSVRGQRAAKVLKGITTESTENTEECIGQSRFDASVAVYRPSTDVTVKGRPEQDEDQDQDYEEEYE